MSLHYSSACFSSHFRDTAACFCKVSLKAYGACIYVQVELDVVIKRSLLCSKSRVSPLKTLRPGFGSSVKNLMFSLQIEFPVYNLLQATSESGGHFIKGCNTSIAAEPEDLVFRSVFVMTSKVDLLIQCKYHNSFGKVQRIFAYVFKFMFPKLRGQPDALPNDDVKK